MKKVTPFLLISVLSALAACSRVENVSGPLRDWPAKPEVPQAKEIAGQVVEKSAEGPWVVRKTGAQTGPSGLPIAAAPAGARAPAKPGAAASPAGFGRATDGAARAEPVSAGAERARGEAGGAGLGGLAPKAGAAPAEPPAASGAAGADVALSGPKGDSEIPAARQLVAPMRAGSTDDNLDYEKFLEFLATWSDRKDVAGQIDDLDVRDVTIESLRTQIGIVLQDTTLFSGTIRDNVAFGRPDASMEEITAAARAASAHDFILSFPDGYETKVGERGTTLSGGQKQRLAIARALLLDPRILILDDSTSSVDTVTEYQIQQALSKLMSGRTSFVIAQRISTVLKADQILVLDDGQIAAQGTHRELLETSPIYREIYDSQLGNGIAAAAGGAQ